MVIRINKANYILRGYNTDRVYNLSDYVRLYIVSNIEPVYERQIIIKESATGDNGYVIDNGRLQLSITISGELLADSNEDLMSYEKQLIDLQGEIVEFIPSKFRSRKMSNKFFIQSFRPQYSTMSDVAMPFTMVLQEYRSVNVKTSGRDIDETNLSVMMKNILVLNETNAETSYSQIVYDDIIFKDKNLSEVVKKITGTDIVAVEKEIYDGAGNLIKTVSRGYAFDSNNRIINTLLNVAGGYKLAMMRPIFKITDVADTEIVYLENGSQAIVKRT